MLTSANQLEIKLAQLHQILTAPGINSDMQVQNGCDVLQPIQENVNTLKALIAATPSFGSPTTFAETLRIVEQIATFNSNCNNLCTSLQNPGFTSAAAQVQTALTYLTEINTNLSALKTLSTRTISYSAAPVGSSTTFMEAQDSAANLTPSGGAWGLS